MSEIPAGEQKAAQNKLGTATAIIRCVQSLIPPMDNGADVWQEYWDVTARYGDFTDEELVPLGITTSDLANYITVLENYNKFVTNQAPATANYKATLNTARRLSA